MSVKIKLQETAYDRFVELLGGKHYLEKLRNELSNEGIVSIDSACNMNGVCGIALSLSNYANENQKPSRRKKDSIRTKIFNSFNKAIYETAEKPEYVKEVISLLGTDPANPKGSPDVVVYENSEAASKELVGNYILH
jgi:hypothetical protein